MALTNNDIIKKLRVALHLRDVDIIKILKLVDYDISKSELSAFFRNEDHPHYRKLKDQILRNFLNGLVIYKRGEKAPKKEDKPANALAKKTAHSAENRVVKKFIKPKPKAQ